jgi:chloride channel 7
LTDATCVCCCAVRAPCRLIENDVFKQDWRARGRGHILRYVALKWALCFLVGALAAAAGFVANLGVENVAGAKFVVTSDLMLDGR